MQTHRGGVVAMVLTLALVAMGGPGLAGVWATAPASAQAGPWAVAPSPSPAGLMANQLNAVSCPSTGACTAVGLSSTPVGATALIETLGPDGWALTSAPQVAGPQVSGPYSDDLEGVSCASASSCVAVGYYQVKGGSQQTLVETLANGIWSVTTSPNRGSGDNQLASVSCPQPSACVAVGTYQSGGTTRTLAEELFGGSWVLTTSPNSGSGSNVLSDVSCPAVGACTAVGYFDNGTVDRALAETLSASVWAVTPVQDQGTGLNELNGISCPATGSCVSVGTYRTAAGVNQDLIETLAAGTWSVHHPSPDANGANNELTAVSCTALTSCMSVGHYNSKGVAQSLAIELAHGTWTVVQSPDKGTSTNQLVGVSCLAGAALECEGVGYYNDLISGFADVAAQALAETWSGGSWSLVPAADAMVSDVSANGVSCSAAGPCVAVGSYVNASGIREVFIEDLANGTWSMVPGQAQPHDEQPWWRVVPVGDVLYGRRVLCHRQDGSGADREALRGDVGGYSQSRPGHRLQPVERGFVRRGRLLRGRRVLLGGRRDAGADRNAGQWFVDFDPEPGVDCQCQLFGERFLFVAYHLRGGGLRLQRDRPTHADRDPGQRSMDRRQ